MSIKVMTGIFDALDHKKIDKLSASQFMGSVGLWAFVFFVLGIAVTLMLQWSGLQAFMGGLASMCLFTSMYGAVFSFRCSVR